MVQLSEGGEGFGIRYEHNNAAGAGQKGIYRKRPEASGYIGEQGSIVFTTFPHNERKRGNSGTLSGNSSGIRKLSERGAAVIFSEDGGTLLGALPGKDGTGAKF